MSCVNLVDVLARRSDSSSIQYRERVEEILEERFVQNHDYFDYDLSPEMVLSTIAIAISSNGTLVASTHGDHTVKVFQHDTGKFIHSFQGHPRTPWTVKFHPTDANFVASGCLGCEVRVWDIRKRICRSYIRLGYSIISLSFQPNGGAHIGIASGPQLLFWDWKRSATPEEDDVMYSKVQGHQIPYPNQKIEPVLVHSRNIRAIIFHPIGTLSFAAAPDPPRQANAAPSPCRLYACECPLVGNMNNLSSQKNSADHQPPPLDSMPTLIPQIHLYSDGGLDISVDGHFLFTCAMLGTKYARGIDGNSNVISTPPLPLPPQSHERNFDIGPKVGLSVEDSYDSSKSDFTTETESDNDGHNDHDVDASSGCEDVGLLETSLRNMRINRDGSSWSRVAPVTGTHQLGDILGRRQKIIPLPGYTIPKNGNTVRKWTSIFSADSSPPPDEVVSSVVTDGSHLLFLVDPVNICPAGWNIEERLCLFKINLNMDEDTTLSTDWSSDLAVNDPKTVTQIGSISDTNKNKSRTEKLEGSNVFVVRDDHVGDPNTLPTHDSKEVKKHVFQHIASVYDEKGEKRDEDGDKEVDLIPKRMPSVTLMRSRPLPGSLMRAVTSMKLSPSGRLGLIGYGVRVHDNVLHHENKKVSCEILDLSSNMPTCCLMTDEIDEVNIAQFHPVPGAGVLYGTKRGKVRVFFTKSKQQ